MTKLFKCRECGNVQALLSGDELYVDATCHSTYCNEKNREFKRITAGTIQDYEGENQQ